LLEPVRAFAALPLEFIAWLVRSLYLMVPRYLWWVAFLILGYVLAFNGLMGKAAQIGWSASRPVEAYGEPRVARLARYVRLRGNPFHRHRLHHLITEVALRALALGEQGDLPQMRQVVSRGQLDLPPEIQEFLQAGLPPWPDTPLPPVSLFSRLFPPRPKLGAARLEAEEALEFFEDYLEVPRED
jgi:hypothetical protein